MMGEIKDERPVDDLDVEQEEVEDSDEELSADALEVEENVGDISVEINVEELVAKLEATGEGDVDRQREIRKRLGELEEQRRDAENLDSTYNINLDDEL
jgi:hypothetical protein